MRDPRDADTNEWPEKLSADFYRFMEAIDEGKWPFEINFELDLKKELPVLKTLLGEEPPAMPEPPKLRGTYRLSRERMKDIILERFRSATADTACALANLALLARVDRPCFVETAADYVQSMFAASDCDLGSETLAGFIADLHELDAELPVEILEHTLSIDQHAGDVLRSNLIEAITESACAEPLGLLAAQALRDRLESS